MQKTFSAILALIILLSLSADAQHLSRKKFNNDWKFKLDSLGSYSGANVNDASWRVLNLPHDWSIEGPFDKNNPATTGGGALPGGMGWYRKTFHIPESDKGKTIFIEFDGVYRYSEVFINGKSLGMRPNGYISFHYDLTPYLKYGSEANIIAVKVDNTKQPNSRWYSGSGIYRNVWLTTLNASHIDHWGTHITKQSLTDKEAIVSIETKITANGDGKTRLITSIYDAAGKKVASSDKPAAEQVNQSIKIVSPQRWSTSRPYLYKAVSQLKQGDKILDGYETSFGLYSFRFDPLTGFYLNDKPMKILGVCEHHDLGALGTAFNTRAMERKLELLKAMGVNGIRTSHNPPAPELLELTDKMGFIVMDEAFDMWTLPKTRYDYSKDWAEWHEKDLRDFVLRDRNHPSVMIWSLGNEIPEQWGDEKKGETKGQQISKELASIIHALDTTRPLVTGNNQMQPWNQLIKSGVFELIGYNYQHQKWGEFTKAYPGKSMIATESTSGIETRGSYDIFPMDSIRRWPSRWDLPVIGNKDLSVSAYDHVSVPWGSTHEESLRELKKWPHVSGMFIWTGFDYIGEPTPYPWPARSSYFGILDLAGFPKDVYYLYQSEFTNTTVLHLLPHWNWKQGDTLDVVAYYNHADEVELFLNGKSLGTRSKKAEDLHVKWRVAYEPGTLKAVSRKNGKTVMVSEVKTAGEAYKLVVRADRSTIKANGEDLSYITVDIVDRNGVLVPRANDLIKFKISGQGEIAGVDSGSPISLESFKGDQHTALNGKALCIVRSNGKSGTISLTATAEGLQPATVQILAK